jgi:hypothetical protein
MSKPFPYIAEPSATFKPRGLNSDQRGRVKHIRDEAWHLAQLIQASTFESADKTLAIRHVEDAVMRAVKAISEEIEK